MTEIKTFFFFSSSFIGVRGKVKLSFERGYLKHSLVFEASGGDERAFIGPISQRMSLI